MSLQKQLLIWVLGCVLAVGLLIQAIVFWHTYRSFSQSQDNNLSYIAELVGSRSSFRAANRADGTNPNHLKDNRVSDANPTTPLSPTSPSLPSSPPLPPDQKPPLTPNVAMQNVAMQNVTMQNMAMQRETPNWVDRDVNNDDNGMLQYQGIKDGIQVNIIPTRARKNGNKIVLPSEYQQLLTLPTGFSQVTLSGNVWKVFRKDTPRRIIFVRQPIDWQKKATLQTAWQAIIPILLSVLVLLFLLPLILKKILRPMQALAQQMAKRDELDLSPILIPKDPQQPLPQELLPLVDEINSLLQRIDNHIKGQNRFIANVAHELRSPLTAISLQAQNLQKQIISGTNDEANWQQKLVQSAQKLVVRVQNNQHLVEQLLTFARIDAKQSTLQQQFAVTIPVMPTLIEAVTLLFPIADSKDINLAIDNRLGEALNDNNWQVALDETSLLVLLKNLIQNAILYTPNLGDVSVIVTTTVEVDTHQNNDLNNDASRVPVLRHTTQDNGLPINQSPRLVLQITDTGIGVSKDKYQKIFQPFVRLSHNGADIRNDSLQKDSLKKIGTAVGSEDSGQFNNIGTGLGLSIVYQICQQANIDIYLSPTKPTGDDSFTTKGLTVTLIF